MSDLFFKLLSELQDPLAEDAEETRGKKAASGRHACDRVVREPSSKTAEPADEDDLMNLDLGMNYDDFPSHEKIQEGTMPGTSSAKDDDIPLPGKKKKKAPDYSDLPDLAMFWPGKTAQYWIPSDDESQDGKHLALDLTAALLGRNDIAPSNTVPLLFYHGNEGEAHVLCFQDEGTPLIRPCEKSIENELYSKSLKDHRILLIPTSSVPKDKLLVLVPPVSNIGVLEKKEEVSWVFEHISNEHERCVFFENRNTPNTLRKSLALNEMARSGLLYIIMCANDLSSKSVIKTDINSPKKAGRKMFEKQLSTLCPGTWNRYLCDPAKKDFAVLIRELLMPIDESGIYHLKKMRLSPCTPCSLTPFSEDMLSSVIYELKCIYLECLPSLTQTIKNHTLIEKRPLSDHVAKSITKLCYERYSGKKESFPELEKTRTALQASLLFLEFRIAGRIADNLIRELTKLESRLIAFSSYDEGKNYLWNYFPNFRSICRKEVLLLQEKSLKLQNAFAEITSREDKDDRNDQ